MLKYLIVFCAGSLFSGLSIFVYQRLVAVRVPKLLPKPEEHVVDDPLKNPDELYRCLVHYYKEEKPYLNPRLEVKDVTERLLTNRTYLNRAIKEHDMINFNYFTNVFRIREAMDIFMTNPRSRVGETGLKCGFNTTAAFTMAFKSIVNMTPKQWKDQYMSTLISKDGKPSKRSYKGRKPESDGIVKDLL